MIDYLYAMAAVILVTVALGFIRVFYGPAEADRLMAAQLLGTGGVAVLSIVAVAAGVPAIVDVALMLALLAAFIAVNFVINVPST
jgi:multicomponent Na+:H+ antiporter subunit F